MSRSKAHWRAQPASSILQTKNLTPGGQTIMHFSEASEAFLSTKRQEGFSEFTIKAYQLHHRLFIRDIGDKEIDTLTLSDFRTHLSHNSHLKSTSVGAKVRAIKSLFKWLVEEEYLIKNPTLKLKEPKQPQRIPKALNVDEIELLRDSCQTQFEHALIEFFFATGCRVSEVQKLNRDDIDWQRMSVKVIGKGNKEREVYFGAKARIWLKRYLKSRTDEDPALFATHNAPHRMSVHHLWANFKTIADRCGLREKVSPHKMRHSLATTLLNQGAPIVAVQSLLGHSKPETTQLYAVLSGQARKQAYDRYFVQ